MRYLVDAARDRCGIGADDVSYIRIAGDAKRHAPPKSLARTFQVQAIDGGAAIGRALVVDSAGLWFAAYGRLDAYESMLEAYLKRIASSGFSRILWTTTPSVHPSVYGGLASDKFKWAMTPQRCARINEIAASKIRAFNSGRSKDEVGIEIVDLWPMTVGREDDPREPGDMRHFGPSTMAALLGVVLNKLCL